MLDEDLKHLTTNQLIQEIRNLTSAINKTIQKYEEDISTSKNRLDELLNF